MALDAHHHRRVDCRGLPNSIQRLFLSPTWQLIIHLTVVFTDIALATRGVTLPGSTR